ncbi:mitogen-activated protein kinase 9-like [Asparagus officinalis]|uniref:mitogen-activated protein kinase 9-like n=1 Tax=Asparagus officinalis TaxID=4686 RepID=UPI00098E6AD2|nr:mitogen-activated protein kinase 9-like [Asparagus officinalis]
MGLRPGLHRYLVSRRFRSVWEVADAAIAQEIDTTIFIKGKDGNAKLGQSGDKGGAFSSHCVFSSIFDVAKGEEKCESTNEADFFTEYGEASRYQIHEVVGKGSYGVVDAAVDTHNGEKVTIKKINDVFEHVSDATRILRKIKLLGLLRHPDIVEIRHIMLPPSRREFKDIYVVFKLMESNLNQVIKANDDLTPEHHQFLCTSFCEL